jgi:hypothetical protein
MGFSVSLTVASTNDRSGGRVFIWIVLMAMVSRLLMERTVKVEQVLRPAGDRPIISQGQSGIRVGVKR